jgi:ABC-type Mn2+/Zn2+ transport system permease subunit
MNNIKLSLTFYAWYKVILVSFIGVFLIYFASSMLINNKEEKKNYKGASIISSLGCFMLSLALITISFYKENGNTAADFGSVDLVVQILR